MSSGRLESRTLTQNSRSIPSVMSALGPAAVAAAVLRAPTVLNAKSPLSDEESQGVWVLLVSRSTPSRTRLNMISTGRSGTLMFCRMCLVYMPLRPKPSAAVDPGDVAYAIRVPDGELICARPALDNLKLAANGLSRQASRMMKLKRVRARSMRSKIWPISTEKKVTSSSLPMAASIGMR